MVDGRNKIMINAAGSKVPSRAILAGTPKLSESGN